VCSNHHVSVFFLIVLSTLGTTAFVNVKDALAAPLVTPGSQPTSNIVTTKASYEILFTTATAGTITTITMAFPPGFSVTSAILIERSGIGAGALSASGTTLTYTVSSPVSIPAGIPMRLEIANIVHPGVPGAFLVTITTKNSFNVLDGPTSSTTPIVQIGAAAIANGAVTNPKLADNSVASRNVAPGAIGTTQLSNGAVGTNQLADLAVTNGDIADGAVTSTKISHGAVSIFSVHKFSSRTTVHPGNTAYVFAGPCPPGYVATGGGFEYLYPLEVRISEGSSSKSFLGEGPDDVWFTEVFNPTSGDLSFRSQVICTTVIP
jgi:hypothetical protein